MRKTLSAFLIVCIMMSMCVLVPVNVKAESTIISRSEAIRWLYSVEGTSVDTPYGYAGECASLGYRYYEKLLGRAIFADSGGTGHGKEYDDDNHSVNLGWTRTIISSDTELQEGDIIVSNYEPYGHVAIYLSGTVTNATLIHQANSDYFGGKVKINSGNNLVGRTCVRPMWKDDSKPTNCTITADDTFVQPGQTVTFTFTQNGATWWCCGVYKDGQRISNEALTGEYTYKYTFEEEGVYKVYLNAMNTSGWTEPYIYVTVSSKKPYNISITPDKTYASPGESVNFDFTVEHAMYWYCEVQKNGERQHLELVTGEYSYEYTFEEEGLYEVFLKTANDNGWTEPSVWITVSSTPEKPELKSLKPYYLPDTPIVFEWDDTGATTHYNLHIHKQGSSGAYGNYSMDTYVESGHSLELPVGNYRIFLQSTNSNAWDTVNNTWKFTNSDYCYVTIADEYIPTAALGYNDHMYIIFDYKTSWKDAKTMCENLGGHLATVTLADEHLAIKQLLKKGTGRYYLGGTDEEEEGVWKWVTGEPWGVEFWGEGEPSNAHSGAEHYLEIWGSWNDTPNEYSTNGGSVCEIEEPLWVQARRTDKGIGFDIAYQYYDSSTLRLVTYEGEKIKSIQTVSFGDDEYLTHFTLPYNESIDSVRIYAWDSNLTPMSGSKTIYKSEWN